MSSYGLSTGKRSPFGNISSAISRCTSEADRIEGFRLIEIAYSPLIRNDCSETDDLDELFISPRDYGSRQAYLRSYTFTRAEPKAQEKVRKSLLRLKAAAWAVVACKYRLPLRARILKEKMIIKTSEYLNNGAHYLRPSCLQMPKCLMAGG